LDDYFYNHDNKTPDDAGGDDYTGSYYDAGGDDHAGSYYPATDYAPRRNHNVRAGVAVMYL
jgi:hypothetical protein